MSEHDGLGRALREADGRLTWTVAPASVEELLTRAARRRRGRWARGAVVVVALVGVWLGWPGVEVTPEAAPEVAVDAEALRAELAAIERRLDALAAAQHGRALERARARVVEVPPEDRLEESALRAFCHAAALPSTSADLRRRALVRVARRFPETSAGARARRALAAEFAPRKEMPR